MAKNKKKYKIKNWSDYNKSLKQRGTMEVWINDDILDKWDALRVWQARGSTDLFRFSHSDSYPNRQSFSSKARRQAQGLLENVFKLMKVKLPVPDYSTVSGRSSNLNILLTKKVKKKGEKMIVVIDSTGLKVYGEGDMESAPTRRFQKKNLAQSSILMVTSELGNQGGWTNRK